MAELYSIAGIFNEDFPGMSPFGGFLIRGNGIEEEIEGRLIDAYGPSKVNGRMDSESLEFLKQYLTNKQQSFKYNFRMKEGLWVGEYSSIEADYRGRATCKTDLVIGNLEFKEFDFSTEEGFYQALIKNMVKSE